FVVAFYNPKSGRRTRQIVEAQRILLKYRSPDTPVGLVKAAYRDTQDIVLTTLEEMLEHDIGMLTTVVVGNSSTFYYDNKIITPRGYQRKYTLGEEKQLLKPHQRLKKEAEPWALDQETGEAKTGYEKIEAIEKKIVEPTAIKTTALQLATEALALVHKETSAVKVEENPFLVQQEVESIFEFAVSPGVANKMITPAQMITLAEVVGERGTMEYTPDHRLVLKVPTDSPQRMVETVEKTGLLVQPVGDVVIVKA